MASTGESRPEHASKRIPVRAEIDGSDLCLQCGLCCDGTLFQRANLAEGEQALAESLGLAFKAGPFGEHLELPCPRFDGGCCSVYSVPRPKVCGAYRCDLLDGYVAGTIHLDDALPVIQLVRSLTRELEVEIGIGAGQYTRGALQQYLEEIAGKSSRPMRQRFARSSCAS